MYTMNVNILPHLAAAAGHNDALFNCLFPGNPINNGSGKCLVYNWFQPRKIEHPTEHYFKHDLCFSIQTDVL